MKKNGFIAMSLIYTFFIVFIVVLLSIMTFYLENNELVRKMGEEITTRYNENIDGRSILDLYNRGIIKRGDYVNLETNDENYASGKWFVLKKDAANVYLVSGFVMGYINSNSHNLTQVGNLYRDKILNSNYTTGDIMLLSSNDLWTGSNKTMLQSTNREYMMWNIGTQYFVVDGANTNRIVAPNCSCSGTIGTVYHTSYFANTKPPKTRLSEWYNTDGYCKDYNNLVLKSTYTCPVRYLSDPNIVIENTYVSGVRIVIRLRTEVFLLGGDGSIGTPYRLGVN